MSYLPIMVIIVLSAALLTAMVFLPVTGGLVGEASHWMGRHALGPGDRCAGPWHGFGAMAAGQGVIGGLLGLV
jgi:hypothetical protein